MLLWTLDTNVERVPHAHTDLAMTLGLANPGTSMQAENADGVAFHAWKTRSPFSMSRRVRILLEPARSARRVFTPEVLLPLDQIMPGRLFHYDLVI